MFSKALNRKLYDFEHHATYTNAFWDKIIFNKIKNILGGQVRMMVTGSAPINKDVLNFLKVCFCCPILEGYGQTETSAAATMCYNNDRVAGHVGGPFVNVKIKLRDIPEMEYYSTDEFPRGEICF